MTVKTIETTMTTVTEVIHVNHELDLLEAHIVEASHYADRIVIKEGECNWHGNPKPLHVTENWNRFKKYPKLEVMIIPADFFRKATNRTEMQLNENGTRHFGWKEVSNGADYVIECDVDEIIDHDKVNELYTLMETKEYLHISVRYANRLWYMNNKLNKHDQYRVFRTGEPEICLMPKGRARCRTSMIGWHFSGCFDGSGWERKYTDMHFLYGFSVEEINAIDWAKLRKEKLYVDKHRNLKPLGGEHELVVDLKEYPEFVRHHPELFPWYGSPQMINNIIG